MYECTSILSPSSLTVRRTQVGPHRGGGVGGDTCNSHAQCTTEKTKLFSLGIGGIIKK